MDPEPPHRNEQATLWNGSGGQGWVAAQELLDQTLKPFEQVLIEAVSGMGPIGRVLDVGCGTGSTTLAVARVLGPKGHCTGIDISRPMIDAAQARAERENEQVTFLCDDAQTHAFQPQSFDAVVSRFGVMFFDDFTRAFENLRNALRPGGELRLIVWRSPSENPFMTVAERASAPLLPDLPPAAPTRPASLRWQIESGSSASSRRAAGSKSRSGPWIFAAHFPSGTWFVTSPRSARSDAFFRRPTTEHAFGRLKRSVPRLIPTWTEIPCGLWRRAG
jgi:ubiquinone/menaquinone biosynthesis C-methylase UbiE